MVRQEYPRRPISEIAAIWGEHVTDQDIGMMRRLEREGLFGMNDHSV
jgi:hypothetical protein